MRNLSAAMQAHLAGTAHKRCTMMRIDLADGSVLAVTDHDRVLSFDLGDGVADYRPETGVMPSDLLLTAGFSADQLEVAGPVTEDGLTTRPALLGGRFDMATVRLFQVNWSNLAAGAIPLLKGEVVLAEIDGSAFRLTVHSQGSRLGKSIGRVITGYCDADFMDARCGYAEAPTVATVTAVTDARTFTVSFAGTIASDWFNKGTVSFLTGDLAGARPVEVFDFAGGAGSGALALWTALPAVPAVGDTLNLKRGCEGTRPACMAYGNIENFRGFPDVPGSDQLLRFPNPGGA